MRKNYLELYKSDIEYMISKKILKEKIDYKIKGNSTILKEKAFKKIDNFVIKKKLYIRYLRCAYALLGKPPSRRQLVHNQKMIYLFRAKWNDILIIAGIDRLYATDFSKEDVKKFIKNWSKENGRSPTAADIVLAKKNGAYIPHPQIIGTLFGSWNKMLQECDLGVVKNSHRGKFEDMTDNELLEILKSEIARIGSTSNTDYIKNKSKSSPSSAYYIKKFNGWRNAINKALSVKDGENNEIK